MLCSLLAFAVDNGCACQDCHRQNTFALADAESFSFGFLASLNHLQQQAMNAAPCSVLVSIMAVRVAFLTFASEQEALAVRLNTNLIVKIHVCAEKNIKS